MLARLFRSPAIRNMSATASKPRQPSAVDGRSFRLALVQLGGCTPSKATNLERARDLVLKAAKGKDGDGSVDMIVLPECFNSLYGAGTSSSFTNCNAQVLLGLVLQNLQLTTILQNTSLPMQNLSLANRAKEARRQQCFTCWRKRRISG